MKRFAWWIRRIYRLSLKHSKMEALVWKDLKRLFVDLEWKHGVYESEKFIVSDFAMMDGGNGRFFYEIKNDFISYRAIVFEGFSTEKTSDFFILATHFNNLLTDGVVTIDVENKAVQYFSKKEIMIPLLYRGEIYRNLLSHYDVAQDIRWVSQKLVEENEAPAIIIADFLRMLNDRENESDCPEKDSEGEKRRYAEIESAREEQETLHATLGGVVKAAAIAMLSVFLIGIIVGILSLIFE